MRAYLITIALTCGKLMGITASVFPEAIQKVVARTLQFLIATSPDRISSFLYIVGNELVKHIYKNARVPVFLTKTFYGDVCMLLDVTKKTQRILYLQRTYESDVSNYIRKNLKKNDVFVDIGANVGYYTLLAAKIVGDGGTVYSFEPEKNNFATLVKNIDLNNVTNIVAVPKAVGHQPGITTLNINPLNEGGASIVTLDRYHDDKDVWSKKDIRKRFPDTILEQETEVVTLDMCLKHTAPTMIKIDVEGAELPVLKGAVALLAKESTLDIICEVGRDREKILDLLSLHGYSLYTLKKDGTLRFYVRDKNAKIPALLASKRHNL